MNAEQTVLFKDLGLNEQILQAVTEAGYTSPSPVQAAAIPHVLEGKDILAQAQTGTGKTAAFALPVLSRLAAAKSEDRNTLPRVLVLAPTRELALQVADSFAEYSKHLPKLKVLPVYGGTGYSDQLRALKRGVDIIVGTPGRVIDHIKKGSLKLDGMEAIVLDEADEMLRMGFIDDVEWVLANAPEKRQVALFSATMPKQIQRVAEKYLKEPELIKIASKTTTNTSISQSYWGVRHSDKKSALLTILEAKPLDAAIIFVRTKTETVAVTETLEANGYAAAALNGDIAQAQRERTIEQLKKGRIDILVATDVAARGIDVERIGLVINYDMPFDPEAYTHRIGRTGRAGREGEAILFVAPRETRMLSQIERVTRQKIEKFQMPSLESVNERRIANWGERLQQTLDKGKLDEFKEIIFDYQKQFDVDLLDIAAAFAKQAQGDKPLLMTAEALKMATAGSDKRKSRDRDGRRGERGERGERRRERGPKKPKAIDEGMVRYRIDVGHEHRVKPGNIVGAIANEAGIDSQYIGAIEIYDDFSTVDLPDGMPPAKFQQLAKAYVCNRPMNICHFDGKAGNDSSSKPKRKSGNGPSRKPKGKSFAGKKSAKKRSNAA